MRERQDLEVVVRAQIARLPAPQTATVAGVCVPVVRLAPFEASAPAKLRLAADLAMRGRLAALDRIVL